MKKLMITTFTFLIVLFPILQAGAVDVYQVPVQQQANLGGANWMVEIDSDDLTTATTNTAQTLGASFKIDAKMSCELTHMKLVTAFDTANTNFTGSCAVTVGDGSDADRYLDSTELASDGTEVWLKFGRGAFTGTSATRTNVTGVTLQTGTITNQSGVASGVVVTGVVLSTSAQASLTAISETLGRKVYTADDYIDFTFTPNGNEALSANVLGRAQFFFRVHDAR